MAAKGKSTAEIARAHHVLRRDVDLILWRLVGLADVRPAKHSTSGLDGSDLHVALIANANRGRGFPVAGVGR
jgi:hypothetical protein